MTNKHSLDVIVAESSMDKVLEVNETILEFDTYGRGDFIERIRDVEHTLIVASIASKPVGYMVSYDRDSDGSFYCWMTGTSPEARGNGVLKAMMTFQENWAKSHGYSKISVKTRNNRREMRCFLDKYGFNVVGVERKENVLDNRIFLEKEFKK